MTSQSINQGDDLKLTGSSLFFFIGLGDDLKLTGSSLGPSVGMRVFIGSPGFPLRSTAKLIESS